MTGRALLVWVAIAGCHHAAPAAATEPVRAPLPPYADAVWSGPCTVVLEPASRRERATRIAAMRTWLPAGARIELTALGDRAQRVWIPAAAPKLRMQRLVERAAPLFGGVAPRDRIAVVETPRAWLAGVSLARPDIGDPVELLVMIDRATGEARLGLPREVLPQLPACQHPAPELDEMAFVDAVVGPTVTRFDVVVTHQIRAERTGRTARGVVDVLVGPRAATAPDDVTILERARELLVLDAVTHEVIDRRDIPRMWCGTRPERDLPAEAARLFPD